MQLGERQVANIVTIDGDAPRTHVIHARNEVRERCLPRSGRSDDRERRAGRDIDVEVMQYRMIKVPEVHPLEGDTAANRVRWPDAGPIRDDGLPR